MSKVNLEWRKCNVELNVKDELVEAVKKVFADFMRFYKSEDRFIEFLNYFKKIMQLENITEEVQVMKMVHRA